jgi:ABC-2 type transport system permease protein
MARHELRVSLADRTLPLACLFLVVALGLALANGLSATQSREAVLAQIAHSAQEREGTLQAQLSRVLDGSELPAPFSNPADPASVGSGVGARHAILPYQPLAPLALGQSDMSPNYFRVTYRAKTTFLFDGEIENPWNLMAGSFDAAFVVVYLLPLLVLALGFNLLSAEREQGTLRLLLAQPVRLQGLLGAKVLVRASVLSLVLVLTLGLGLMVWRPEVRSVQGSIELLGWMALALGYGAVWWALAAALNALGRSSAFNALAFATVWVVWVLIAPVLLNLAVAAAHLAPSRAELATQTRLVTIDGLKRYEELLATDYRYVATPDVLRPVNGRFTVPERRRASLLIARDVDREIDERVAAFDRALLTQQAWLQRWAWVSPSALVFDALTQVSGTSSARYARFQQAVSAFHAEWKTYFEPRVLQGVAMDAASLRDRPQFVWHEQSLGSQVPSWALAFAQLALMALALAVAARWGLRRAHAV